MKRAWTTAAALIAAMILTVVMAGCGGGKRVRTDIYIPDLEASLDSDSYYLEGWRNLKEGNPDRAIKNFQESRSADEKLFLGFGYAFLAQDKLDLARKNFQRCLEVDPDNLQAQFGLATIHELLNEKEKAFLLYAKLRAAHPGNAWVKVRYDYIKSTETGNYLKQAEQFKGVNDTAYIEALESAARYSPGIVDIKVEIADFYAADGQNEKAVRQYEEVLETTPNDESVLMKLAGVYENLSRFDSAVVIYKKMLELRPGDLDISNKINELKSKFYELKLPAKFKNIFFKEDLNREELAALIGYYFEDYLKPGTPVIITDIGGSFAKEYIIGVCTLKIMRLRPDHSFDRFTTVNRAAFAVVVDALLKYLQQTRTGDYAIRFTPLEETVEPLDISPLHKDYEIIKFLVNASILKLDEENNFNPTHNISPPEVLVAIKKILNSLRPGLD
jgi:Tfp pilus assembly protein PilF